MTSKRDINKHSRSKKKEASVKYESENDDEFLNSEDEYDSQSGGDTDTELPEKAEDELGDDNPPLDIDPDDEVEFDSNDDDKFDPINEAEEVEDEDDDDDQGIDEKTEESKEEAEEIEDADEEYTGESKTCHLKDLNKDFIVLDEDDSNMYGRMEYKKIPNEERISDPIMTYYEMVRVIGTRAQQFNYGAEPMVEGLEGLHPAKMAYIELISKMTPFIIKRRLPGKRYEEWRIDELEIIHKITDDFFIPGKFDLFNPTTSGKKSNDNIARISKESKSRSTSSTRSGSKSSSIGVAKGSSKSGSKDSSNDRSKGSSKSGSKDSTTGRSKGSSRSGSKDSSNDRSKGSSRSSFKDSTTGRSKGSSKPISKSSSKGVTKSNSKDRSKKRSKNRSK